ncbi:NYN domain-containing protein [Neolewinella lacunae]|uniref:NYN domain-containing protein n=1 Tax=Neolewinella lacunae TaxID=1517758 RepID=A0A923T9L1_9BACT|nr:NYN domain-containing protein [Neolewinella lacunae]MBC6996835.1 NYN domain-containing protein [Neolewinella lacunae]MDN3633813.1 NYN domain-containing protein [Neolewinella lacunae]
MDLRIAILWDFEPLHDAVMALEYGKYWYRNMGEGDQPEVVDVRGLLEHATTKGTVVSNLAFANWQWMRSYAPTFRQHGIRLVQLFPEGRTNQNRAVMEMEGEIKTLASRDDIDAVLVIGGDARYPSLEQLAAAAGKKLLGIGTRSLQEDPEKEKAHHDFAYYDAVGRPLQGSFATFKSVEESHSVLIQTMLTLTSQYGEEWIQQVRIKPAMAKIDSTFQEKDYGYPTFGTYLSDQTTVLERRHFRDEQEPEYRLRPDLELTDQQAKNLQRATNDNDLSPYYLRIAAQQGVRMPRPDMMWIGIDIYASFLEDGNSFASFAELDDECLEQLVKDIPSATLTDAKKIRQVLFKCYIFRPSEDGSIGFHEGVQTLEDIENRYFNLMLARIGNNIREPLDFYALSRALTDSEDSADRLSRLYKEL